MKQLAIATAGLLLSFTVSASAGHHAPPEVADTSAERIEAIEAAHAVSTYQAQDAIQADFVVDFGPMHLEGTMWFTPSMSKVRMEIEGEGENPVIVYDGQTAWLSPADAAVPGPPPRFHVLTWPYFVAVPYKLDDPGTAHAAAGLHPIRSADDKLHGTKITFAPGVGDSPNDWYMAFADPETGRLTALSYIVTYSKDLDKANEEASIVLYDDFVEVDGVPFSTTWTFHFWQPGQGIVKEEPKGRAKLSNIKFVTPSADAFLKPEGAAEAAAPRP